MTSLEGLLPTPREMVEAFVHAPLLVPVGERVEGDLVVVLSHVELWPWRVVVRAMVANPDFNPRARQFPTGGPNASAGVGVVTGEITDQAEQHRERWQRGIEWMNSWTLTDDLGTEFLASGWSGAPSDDQLWSDLTLTYDTVLPPTAQRLIISGPVIGSVEAVVRR